MTHTGTRNTGVHVLTWDGRDDSGERVASGIYLCRLIASGQVRRMVVVR
ncbi:MAG: FlgD immunoglobulin-like domain containing protein [bacterium]